MTDAQLGKLVRKIILDEIKEYLAEFLNGRGLKLRENDDNSYRIKGPKEKLELLKIINKHDKEVEDRRKEIDKNRRSAGR